MPPQLWSLLLLIFLPSARPHGRLIEPPSRATAWRYGFSTPHNYNDHELYCGGFTRQWQRNDGKCGVCGDPWDSPLPRAHEYGGKYGQGVIVRKYAPKSTITIRIELTASHMGFFEFRLCPNFKNTTQECLDEHIISLIKSADQDGTRFYPRDGNKIYEMRYRLPDINCEHCVLQWKYIAGNNWGNCPNGTGMVGCGPQEEFRACADISITSKHRVPTITPPITVEPTETTPEATSVPPESPTEPHTYSPVASIIVTLAVLLCCLLVLALLYIYYYEVGHRVKGWLKGGTAKDKGLPPVPPPRARRKTQDNELYNVSLDIESNA